MFKQMQQYNLYLTWSQSNCILSSVSEFSQKIFGRFCDYNIALTSSVARSFNRLRTSLLWPGLDCQIDVNFFNRVIMTTNVTCWKKAIEHPCKQAWYIVGRGLCSCSLLHITAQSLLLLFPVTEHFLKCVWVILIIVFCCSFWQANWKCSL